MKKRALILALAGIMAASLIGCGSRKDDAVVVKAGDEEITAGVANFYARYTQAQYETYFASYLGGDDMWSRKGRPRSYLCRQEQGSSSNFGRTQTYLRKASWRYPRGQVQFCMDNRNAFL